MSENRNIAGRRLSGRYTLLSQIAKGGMGEVWKARDQVTGSLVAAKVLRPELVGEEISLSRLRLEAKNAMRAKHPNIAAVLDSGEDESQGWIIMELVDGAPLTDFVGDGKRLSSAELVPIMIQTSYALDAAARANVVHRDIKPANIMIRPDGLVKLTDFGVSLAHGQANLTAAGMVMGTAQYLPPEQAMGAVATPVGDLYALGVIAFEALAGNRPYTGKTQVDIAFAHVNEAIPLLPDEVPEPMAQLVYRLLSKKPEARPATGAALARELVKVAAQLGIGVEPVPLTAPLASAVDQPATIAEGVAAVDHNLADEPVPASSFTTIPAAPSASVEPASVPTETPAVVIAPNVLPADDVAAPRSDIGGTFAAPSAAADPVKSQSTAQFEAEWMQGGIDEGKADAAPVSTPVPPVHHVRRQHLPTADGSAPDVSAAGSTGPAKMSWRPVSTGSLSLGGKPVVGSVHARTVGNTSLPSRANSSASVGSRTNDSSNENSESSNVGMWVIIGLIVLTIVLIVVAMFRGGVASNSSSAAELWLPQLNQEVGPWLTPAHAV